MGSDPVVDLVSSTSSVWRAEITHQTNRAAKAQVAPAAMNRARWRPDGRGKGSGWETAIPGKTLAEHQRPGDLNRSMDGAHEREVRNCRTPLTSRPGRAIPTRNRANLVSDWFFSRIYPINAKRCFPRVRLLVFSGGSRSCRISQFFCLNRLESACT